MAWVANAYWICLLIGIGYTIIAFILGGVGGHGDISHFDHAGSPGHGGGHAGVDSDGVQVLFGPFSPLVIAFFLVCFGAAGIILSAAFRLPPLVSLPVALAASVLLAWAMISVFNRLFGGLASSSEVKFASLAGTEGEVTVDIPPDGLGEIAYVAMGSRYVAPARNEENTTIPRFSGVRITRVVGNMLYVRPLIEDQLRNLDTEPMPDGTRHE